MKYSIQNMKNIIEPKIVCLVDEFNKSRSFGYTKSTEKIFYNLNLFGNLFKDEQFETKLSNSQAGLTALVAIGRYIVVFKINKNMNKMEMMFFDFRLDYSAIDKGLQDIFSTKLITEFKRIKYYLEEEYDPLTDNLVLSLE